MTPLLDAVIVAAFRAQQAAHKGNLFASEEGLALFQAWDALTEGESTENLIDAARHEVEAERDLQEQRNEYSPVPRDGFEVRKERMV